MSAPSNVPHRNFSDAWPGGNTLQGEARAAAAGVMFARPERKSAPEGARSTGVEKT
jgi:hypothetical protein